ADRLPSGDVPGAHAGRGVGAQRAPAAMAQAPAHRRFGPAGPTVGNRFATSGATPVTVRRRHTAPAMLVLGTLLAANGGGVAAGGPATTPAPATGNAGIGARVAASTVSAAPAAADPAMAAAPYLYLGGDNLPDPGAIMKATGVRWFTMAFVLSRGQCDPQ